MCSNWVSYISYNFKWIIINDKTGTQCTKKIRKIANTEHFTSIYYTVYSYIWLARYNKALES